MAQLDDSDGGRDVEWLPVAALPPCVRLVVRCHFRRNQPTHLESKLFFVCKNRQLVCNLGPLSCICPKPETLNSKPNTIFKSLKLEAMDGRFQRCLTWRTTFRASLASKRTSVPSDPTPHLQHQYQATMLPSVVYLRLHPRKDVWD